MKKTIQLIVLVISLLIGSVSAQITAEEQANKCVETIVQSFSGLSKVYPELSFSVEVTDKGTEVMITSADEYDLSAPKLRIGFTMDFINRNAKLGQQHLCNQICENTLMQLEAYGFFQWIEFKRGIYRV